MLANKRHLFDIPEDVAYFNCAYMSPLSKQTTAAGIEGLCRKSTPWQMTSEDFFTESAYLKKLFAKLVNTKSDNIAIIPSASYGLAIAARNITLSRGQKILVLEDQFPSNIYCWQKLAADSGAVIEVVDTPADRDWTRAVLDRIDDTVGLAALANNHWADGGFIDLVQIGSALRAVGAKLVLDVTQSLGALPLDIQAVQPDFLIVAAYKWLLSPYSIGMMYVAPHQQDGEPIEYNWLNRAGSENFAGLVNYQADYQPGATRFDMGQRANFALLPAAISALEQILDWDPANIYETLGQINKRIAEQASAIGLTSPPEEFRAKHFLGLESPGGFPADLLDSLAAQKIFVSIRGNSLRITPHLYNTQQDCDRLLNALENLLGANK
ncbi:aminotransferase class V-fold PLP-dependent enzyme [Sneathiella glossodoripedis]|uniref:aminotransferase class V-fold PLP-dependent enzyme n=1 Tax=Sneathiella glossodoripedis TaxID=418853 RepID=UPI0004725678|nr:aminotransferase class V-fold PLP-dependent enzyme [Sneathiella glossodoripedis]